MQHLRIFISFLQAFVLCISVLLLVAGVYCIRTPGPEIDGAQFGMVTGAFLIFLQLLGAISIGLKQPALIMINILFLVTVAMIHGVWGLKLLIQKVTTIERYLKAMYLNHLKDLQNNVPNVKFGVGQLQQYFECCGMDGPNGNDVKLNSSIYLSKEEDQFTTNWTYLIPECCEEFLVVCTRLDAYDKSCLIEVESNFIKWTQILGSILLVCATAVLGLAVFEIMNLVKIDVEPQQNLDISISNISMNNRT